MSSSPEIVHNAGVRKRRKLNPWSKPSNEDEHRNDLSDRYSSDEDDTFSHGTKNLMVHPEAPKPRHRIHIVENNTIPDDAFFSQIPNSSQSPNRLRGAFWQKGQNTTHFLHPDAAGRKQVDGTMPDSRSAALSPSSGNLQQRPSLIAKPSMGQNGVLTDVRSNGVDDESMLLNELVEIPFDMLSSSARLNGTPEEGPSPEESYFEDASQSRQEARKAPTQTSFRQTTLFGGRASDETSSSLSGTQRNSGRAWPVANRNEPPTHHKLNEEELRTWIYPTNIGTIRDYQYNIVSRGLYHNLLVALPTGLGKTFIAATVMLNWFRWTKDAQIVFVAPTRPLVTQQVRACFEIAGIPRSSTSLLTGNVAPGLRATEWAEKRVFFMTPQTITNDLKTGICDPKRIVLLVVDEAHRATGNYAYVEVVKFLRRFNNSFRVLALTATPGSTIESVQEVIDGLGIARTEIRTEDSIDIRQYVHQRNIDTELFDYSEDVLFIMDLLSSAVKPILQKVNSMNVYWPKDPMMMTAFGCTQARRKWMASPAGRNANFGLKAMVNSILTVLASLAHAIELLKFHGIVPFHHSVLNFQAGEDENGKKGSKYKKQILESPDFKTMLSTVRQWTSKADFLGHPKLEYLSRVVLNHFIDAGEGRGVEADISPSATRIMIFAHYRDSAEEIVRVLKRHSPMVRPHVFVGQAASRGSEGMDQKKQQSIIDDFKKGVYNTLVATSIGEEGLDIGQVDLIVCYDASASPIRMLQRMGRTGRKRAGNIVVLLMRKKEQENFEKAKDNYEKMQHMIAEGSRFNYHDGLSPRILPRSTNPEVEKRAVEIPIENSQAGDELPEPKKKGRAPKRPPKRFNMPDGVITGFMKASEVDGNGNAKGQRRGRNSCLIPEPMPDVESVLLTDAEQADLERRYLDIGGDDAETVEFPRLDRFTELQRQERPSKLLSHGSAAWRTIRLLNDMHDMDESLLRDLERNLNPEDKAGADAALRGDLFPQDETSPSKSLRLLPRVPEPQKKKGPKAKTPTRKKRKIDYGPSSQAFETACPESSMPGTEGEGIDLINTDDEHGRYDEDNDDNGSDLIDFIDDNTPAEASSSMTSSPPTARQKRLTAEAASAEAILNVVASSQATDSDLPDVDTLLRGKSIPSSSTSYVARRRQRRERAVIADDSDEG